MGVDAPDTFASFIGSTSRVIPLLSASRCHLLMRLELISAQEILSLLVTELNMLVHCVSCPSRWAYDSH